MGQQQLLLLVLGAIIVGLAIVVGINMFSNSAINANRDAVVQDCMTIAARAQQFYRTPLALGGGGGHFPEALSLSDLRFPTFNENAVSFSIEGADQSATITAEGTEPANEPSNHGIVTMVISPTAITSTEFSGGYKPAEAPPEE